MGWESSKTLRFALLNAENLFLLFDNKSQTGPLISKGRATDEITSNNLEADWQRLSTSVYENKPLAKCFQLARAINEINPDVLMLCEVGGLESLENFNEMFLDKKYSVALTEGNSDRNIDVGFLIKKDLQFYFDLSSNKNRLINFLYQHERKTAKPGASRKFSRDVAELKLFSRSQDDPFLIILLTHLKSPRDPEGVDPMGTERRRAELNTLVEIYNEVRKKHVNIPMIVAGDFNGTATLKNTDNEFKNLYEKTDLQDVLEVAGVASNMRTTYHQVKPNFKMDSRQLDYCFISPELHANLVKEKTYVHNYKNELGIPSSPPQTLESKLLLPSDHYPVVFELEKVKIW